jgi:mannosyl-3-phosphoglycerate phosphatase
MQREQLVVFSDLDGTLLDHETYAFDAARLALDRLRDQRVPLVLCTSKTRSEVEPVRIALDNHDPFVVENGGGVYLPAGYFPFEIDGAERRGDYCVVRVGDAHADLVRALARASRESGVGVRGFADMTDKEVAEATDLGLEEARLARDREFDEPFVITGAGRPDALLAAIEREGKRWTRGGRFHHITGANDKAAAVRQLMALYRRHLGAIRTVGLGDAPNDATFLSVVDVPILVASPRIDQLRSLVPQGRVTSLAGPAGWNEAVLALLDEQHRDTRR